MMIKGMAGGTPLFLLLLLGVNAEEREFTTPAGATERCVSGVRIPEGRYFPEDAEKERRYCSVDFYAKQIALCPKTWSTSPGTIVYDISRGPFAADPKAFESQSCPKGGRAVRDATSEVAMYKMSMNERDTSGTYSPASLLYYHYSRYFRTVVQVPTAVFRTIDKETHRRRVIEPGLRLTTGKPALRQIHAGWKHYADAVENAAAVSSSAEFLTADRRHLYGVLLEQTGVRYGAEVNGTRAGGWGAGQNRSFQKTPPFLALRQPEPLREAIREGLRLSRADRAMAKAAQGIADAQMVFWMRELTETVLMDFMFGQQDRVGNIDFERRWYWVEAGKLESRPAAGTRPPADLAARKPVLIRRTWLNDNDAGARASYTDFAAQTHMLDGIAHFGAETYRRLMRLDQDFEQRGPLYQHLTTRYGLSAKEISLIERHTRAAAALLRQACRENRIRFDLEPEEFLLHGKVVEKDVDCSGR